MAHFWTPAEDAALLSLVPQHTSNGATLWYSVAKGMCRLGFSRPGRACKKRRESLQKRDGLPWTTEEDNIILRETSRWHKRIRWSFVSARLEDAGFWRKMMDVKARSEHLRKQKRRRRCANADRDRLGEHDGDVQITPKENAVHRSGIGNADDASPAEGRDGSDREEEEDVITPHVTPSRRQVPKRKRRSVRSCAKVLVLPSPTQADDKHDDDDDDRTHAPTHARKLSSKEPRITPKRSPRRPVEKKPRGQPVEAKRVDDPRTSDVDARRGTKDGGSDGAENHEDVILPVLRCTPIASDADAPPNPKPRPFLKHKCVDIDVAMEVEKLVEEKRTEDVRTSDVAVRRSSEGGGSDSAESDEDDILPVLRRTPIASDTDTPPSPKRSAFPVQKYANIDVAMEVEEPVEEKRTEDLRTSDVAVRCSSKDNDSDDAEKDEDVILPVLKGTPSESDADTPPSPKRSSVPVQKCADIDVTMEVGKPVMEKRIDVVRTSDVDVRCSSKDSDSDGAEKDEDIILPVLKGTPSESDADIPASPKRSSVPVQKYADIDVAMEVGKPVMEKRTEDLRTSDVDVCCSSKDSDSDDAENDEDIILPVLRGTPSASDADIPASPKRSSVPVQKYADIDVAMEVGKPVMEKRIDVARTSDVDVRRGSKGGGSDGADDEEDVILPVLKRTTITTNNGAPASPKQWSIPQQEYDPDVAMEVESASLTSWEYLEVESASLTADVPLEDLGDLFGSNDEPIGNGCDEKEDTVRPVKGVPRSSMDAITRTVETSPSLADDAQDKTYVRPERDEVSDDKMNGGNLHGPSVEEDDDEGDEVSPDAKSSRNRSEVAKGSTLQPPLEESPDPLRHVTYFVTEPVDSLPSYTEVLQHHGRWTEEEDKVLLQCLRRRKCPSASKWDNVALWMTQNGFPRDPIACTLRARKLCSTSYASADVPLPLPQGPAKVPTGKITKGRRRTTTGPRRKKANSLHVRQGNAVKKGAWPTLKPGWGRADIPGVRIPGHSVLPG